MLLNLLFAFFLFSKCSGIPQLQDVTLKIKDNLTAVEPYRIITTSIPEGKLEINKRSEVEKIVVCAAFSFLAVVGITGNLLVIFAILTDSSLQTHTQLSNLPVLNLALTDLMTTSLVCIPAAILVIYDDYHLDGFFCSIWAVINATGIVATMGFLMVISIDRFIAVGWFSLYPKYVTYNSLLGAIIFVWTYSFTCGLMWTNFKSEYDFWAGVCDFTWQEFGPKVKAPYYYGIYCGIFYGAVPSLIILMANVGIIQKTKVKVRVNKVEESEDGGTEHKQEIEEKVNERILKAMVIIICAYFILTFPVACIRVLKVLSGPTGFATYIPGSITLVITFLQFSGSIVNPLIYGLFRRDFREAYRKVWRRVTCG